MVGIGMRICHNVLRITRPICFGVIRKKRIDTSADARTDVPGAVTHAKLKIADSVCCLRNFATADELIRAAAFSASLGFVAGWSRHARETSPSSPDTGMS